MSEWWTYRLSSFLMFSPRTYWRLIENYNRDIWPLQLVAFAAGLAMLWLVTRGTRASRFAACLLLALAWVHVGWAFFWTRYSDIFTAAPYLAIACGAQALILVLLGTPEGPARAAWPGWVLALAGVAIVPLFDVLVAGRTAMQAYGFGVMPEPTALASIGLAFSMSRSKRTRIVLSAIPFVMLIIGWGTLANLASFSQ